LNPVDKAETDFTWRLSSDAIITNLQESIKQQSDSNTNVNGKVNYTEISQ